MCLGASSIRALKRLFFRLIVILAFAALWPSSGAGTATGVLALLLAGGCFITAHTFGEPFGGPDLNHWDEGVFLFGIGVLTILVFL
jgi:hypothetical protein